VGFGDFVGEAAGEVGDALLEFVDGVIQSLDVGLDPLVVGD
jgi:hypothetical protein